MPPPFSAVMSPVWRHALSRMTAARAARRSFTMGESLRERQEAERVHRNPLLWLQAKAYMPFPMLNRAFQNRPALRVLIAAPRGFCAGVDRAIQIVELALERFGAPVYVRHEIVHNRFVVERLKQ